MAATEVILQSPYTLEIPHEIAQSMGLRPGMRVYLYQLEQTLSIRLQPSKLLDACEQFERTMQEEGVTLDDLLEPLVDEEEEAVGVTAIASADEARVDKALEPLPAKDATVWACAVAANVDFFITLNRRHFKQTQVLENSPFRILLPSEFADTFRAELQM